MTLAAPLGLALLAIAVPVVVAFLARQRAPRQVVGSVMLLRRAAGMAVSRSLVPRLRHPIALALTLMALLALALGVASPRCGDSPVGRWIVVLDAPPEAGAGIDADRTAWREVFGRLETLLRSPGIAEVAVLHSAPVPRVIAGVTSDFGGALALAGAVRPGASGDPVQTRQAADALCVDPELDAILWVGASPPPQGRCPILALRAAARPPLTELVGIKATRTERLGELEILVAVADTTGAPTETVVELFVDDVLVEVVPANTVANGVGWTRRTLPVDGQVVAAALVSPHPAARARVVAVGPPASPVRVVWLSAEPPPETSFLRAALELHPRVRLEFFTTADGAQNADLLIVDGALPLPEGARLAWAIGPEAAANAGILVLEPLDHPSITRWDFRDPLLQHLDLDGLTLTAARALAPPVGGSVMVEAEGYPVVVRSRNGSNVLLASGFTLEDSDLPLRVDFLHWVANLVEEASPNDNNLPLAEVGRPWPGAAEGEVLTGPSGPMDPRSPLPEAGLYTITGKDGTERGRVTPAVIPAPPRPEGSGGEAPMVGVQGQPWWVWATIAAAILLAAETVLGATLRARLS